MRSYLANISTHVAVTNQGSTAGIKSAVYDLGTKETPVKIIKENALDKLIELINALRENNEKFEFPPMFIIISRWYHNILNPLPNEVECNIDDGSYVNNVRYIGSLDDIDIFVSKNIDSSYCIAGRANEFINVTCGNINAINPNHIAILYYTN